jgi:hypothetical protein
MKKIDETGMCISILEVIENSIIAHTNKLSFDFTDLTKII